MNPELILQLLTSFLLGGALITTLSLIAEKTNEKIAGIIMMFPSTVVLGFFFLGITTSPQAVSTVIPATLAPLGIVIFSSVIYIGYALAFSKLKVPRSLGIIFTFLATSISWYAVASPFAILKLNDLATGIAGYFVIIAISYYLLNKDKLPAAPVPMRYTLGQIAFRACFVGLIIATVVLLGKTSGPFWGGLFSMYPAATVANLMILNYYYKPEELAYFFRKAPLGSLSIFAYCISVMHFYPVMGLGAGTIAAYCVSLLVAVSLIYIQKKGITLLRYGNKTTPNRR